jgi:hypothetical protein
MALKDFDYKQFLLEKGERVGLYTAGGLGLLLIFLSLVWPGKAIFNASPKPEAEKLTKAAQEKNAAVQNAAPSDQEKVDLRKVDPQLLKEASTVAEDPANYRMNSGDLFAPRDIGTSKRRNPNVLVPAEFEYKVVPAQISDYMIKQEGDKVLFGVLTERKTGSKPGKPGSDFSQNFNRFFGGGGAGRSGSGGMPGAPGMGGGPGMPGSGGGPGMGSGQRGSYGPGGSGGAGTPFGDEKKNQEIKFVPKEDFLNSNSPPELARDLMARQIAVISAAFPFNAQVQEFQKALHIDNPAGVFAEKAELKNKQGQKVEIPAFRFLGFNVNRRTVGPDGNPTSDWQPLDLESPSSPYRWVMAQVLNEAAPEDPKVQPLLYPGLYMHRPVQIPVRDKEKGGPVSKPYPEFEQGIPKIKDTLDKLNPQQKAPPTGKSRFDTGDFDPFGGQNTPTPEGGEQAPETPKDWTPAEYCVLRFLDVTVKPGQTYEYQIRVRMANPNLNKPATEVAYPALADPRDNPDLKSEIVPVKGLDGQPLRVSVPTDLHIYAVDEQALARKEKREYKGMNAGKAHDSTKQAVVQIHRWMDQFEQTVKSVTHFFPVGDWVVGERLFVYRGELLSARVPTHVPIWAPEHSAFTLAGRPPAGRDKKPTEEVTFFKEQSESPLLVDFEGGSVAYQRRGAPPPKAEDGTPEEGAKPTPPSEIKEMGTTSELLFLTPEGKLVARNSAQDETDEDRKKREAEFIERVDEASGKPPEPPKPMQ